MERENLKQRIKEGELLIGVSVPLNASKDQMEAIIEKDNYAFISLIVSMGLSMKRPY